MRHAIGFGLLLTVLGAPPVHALTSLSCEQCVQAQGCHGEIIGTCDARCDRIATCYLSVGCIQQSSTSPCVCGTAPPPQCASTPGAANGPCLEVYMREIGNLSPQQQQQVSSAASGIARCAFERCRAECVVPLNVPASSAPLAVLIACTLTGLGTFALFGRRPRHWQVT